MPIEWISVAGAASTNASVRRFPDSPRGWRLRIRHHLNNPRASGFALVRCGTISVTGNAVSWGREGCCGGSLFHGVRSYVDYFGILIRKNEANWVTRPVSAQPSFFGPGGQLAPATKFELINEARNFSFFYSQNSTKKC